ncbi:hypothetical protein AUC68_11775 [Methyloceanibacter methanicus]|uniref:Uncharacterized protein n=1 Tax=Methyloceanibacter methanicus TaxID=1774968 RepID=A0A1E3W5Q9_9HYPH|nr:hypothetical protein [Methyloceanibacter methanicus]ODS01060.1 hypothetical protein AUC68_11775 [Methyloceanibacter methanicus]
MDDLDFYGGDERVVVTHQNGIAVESMVTGDLLVTVQRDDNTHMDEFSFEVARHAVTALAGAMLERAGTGLVVAAPEDLKSSKTGASRNAERQRRYRERKRDAESVTESVTPSVTPSVTRDAPE